ncbi:TIGR01244 family sulfur transferase [Hoeflea sp.]|uniref:TIGR01244 family sulfur transferase n=1 Tax=Hoeflea sp. TaxID=1940281 RepID=UPI003BAEB51E
MDLRPIDQSYSVAGQISPEDLEAIKAAGFKSVVCHRPDGEAPDQPAFDEIRRAAEAMGLETRHIPIGPMGVTADAVREMVDAIEELPKPMLGYCRSGARSTAVYQHTAHLRG